MACLPLRGAALAVVVMSADVLAQTLPLAPMSATVASVPSSQGVNRWKSGPLILALPPGWTVDATRGVFSGPRNTKAAVAGLRVTPEGRRNGYSVLTDPTRRPENFARWVDMSDCSNQVL